LIENGVIFLVKMRHLIQMDSLKKLINEKSCFNKFIL
jgi:hypothetical protein